MLSFFTLLLLRSKSRTLLSPPLFPFPFPFSTQTSNGTPANSNSLQGREMPAEMVSLLRTFKEEGCLKDTDFDYQRPVLRNLYSLNLLKSATEEFALKHQPLAKWLSGEALKQLALYGCPSLERRTVMAAKRLCGFFRIQENTVCKSCKMQNSCRFVNQRVERQEKVILTDVLRLLILYALDAIPPELSVSENLKLSINKLLNEVINLSTRD